MSLDIIFEVNAFEVENLGEKFKVYKETLLILQQGTH